MIKLFQFKYPTLYKVLILLFWFTLITVAILKICSIFGIDIFNVAYAASPEIDPTIDRENRRELLKYILRILVDREAEIVKTSHDITLNAQRSQLIDIQDEDLEAHLAYFENKYGKSFRALFQAEE